LSCLSSWSGQKSPGRLVGNSGWNRLQATTAITTRYPPAICQLVFWHYGICAGGLLYVWVRGQSLVRVAEVAITQYRW